MAKGEIRNVHLLTTGATDVALMVFSILGSILVARLLGPTGRGEYAVVLLWPSVLAAVGSLGIRDATVYEQARGSYPRSQVAGTALLIALGQAIVLMLAGAVLIPRLTSAQSAEVTRAAMLYLLFIPANLVTEYTLASLQGALDITIYNAVRLLMGGLYTASLVLLWVLGYASVTSLTVALLLANYAAMLAALAALISRQGLELRGKADLSRGLVSYGVRNHVGSVSNLLNQRADQMLMALLLPPQQLGWYAVAVSVSALPRLAPGALATLTMPGVATVSDTAGRKTITNHSRVNVSLLALACAGLALLAPLLIPLLYGPSFAPSILPAEILILATFFAGIGQVWAAALRGLGRPAAVSIAEVISLGVTVAGLWLLLRPLGIIGAAITSVVAYATSTAYLYRALHRRSDLALSELLRPVSARSLLAAMRLWRS